MPITTQELMAVDRAVRALPGAGSYRVTHSGDSIEIFERLPPDLDDMLSTFGIGRRAEGVAGPFVLRLRLRLLHEETRVYALARPGAAPDTWDSLDEGPLRGLLPQIRANISPAG